jgi:Major Facilitator Superfamily
VIVALFLLTFAESVAGTLLQRGVYFYTHEHLGFTERHNLWVAFGFGVTYTAGAAVSHALSKRYPERTVLLGCMFALLGIHALLALFPAAWVLVSGVLVSAAVQGAKWPVVESYVSAGRPPRELLALLGRFNVTWATAGFVAVGITGAIVGNRAPSLFFWLPAALNVVAIACAWRFPARPRHVEHGHPSRPAERELVELRSLLGSARWSMMASYSLLYVLAPLMPSVLAQLALPLALATPVNSLLDATRVLTFGALGALGGWHGKRAPLWLVTAALPAGFALILLGGSLPLLLLGEVLFGVAAGFAYTSSLYYALVAENASVDAGGAHEALIGLGIALGPLSGLAGQLLVAPAGGPISPFVALAMTTTPIVGVCVVGSLRALLRLPGRRA